MLNAEVTKGWQPRERTDRSCAAQLNLSSPFLTTKAPGVCASLIYARGSICRPATILPPLPGLLFAKTIRPAICATTSPVSVRMSRRAHELLASCNTLLLFRIFGKIYSKRGISAIRTWSLV